uniref:Dus domain-containing protein n=1 Tax=Steinernema glaseri TaxID=37863 RepID=A0A1I7Z1Y6_9BILA
MNTGLVAQWITRRSTEPKIAEMSMDVLSRYKPECPKQLPSLIAAPMIGSPPSHNVTACGLAHQSILLCRRCVFAHAVTSASQGYRRDFARTSPSTLLVRLLITIS